MYAKELIKTRRSIRNFTGKKVDRNIIKEAVELASFSPSWAHTQSNRYNIIDDPNKLVSFAQEVITKLGKNKKIIEEAAGIIVMSYEKKKSGYLQGESVTSKGDAWGMYDAGIAAQTLSLALHELGLGSVILGVYDVKKAEIFLDLPENETVSAIIPYGYPDETGRDLPRLKVDEIIRFI